MSQLRHCGRSRATWGMNIMTIRRLGLPFYLTCTLAVGTAAAQETRAAIAEQQRAEKSKQLQPYVRGKAEAAVFRVEDRYLVQRIFNPPRGLFARFGGLPEGAGLAAGPAYRYSTHNWSATATSAYSVRSAWEVEGRLAFPPPTPTPAPKFISVGGHYRDLPEERFYGFG